MQHPRHAETSHIPSLPLSSTPTPWTHPRWLYGLDLFHAQFYWEAHEVWEALWHTLGRPSADAHVIQGMIQLAASLLTEELGRRSASARLAVRAHAKLAHARVPSHPAHHDVRGALQWAEHQK